MEDKLKIAIVVSHPIQHFCPQYVSFAENKNITLKVFFGSALGHKKYIDKNFKEEIAWGNLDLHKFDHVFLNGEAVLQADKNLDAKSLEKELNDYHPDLLIGYGYFQRLQRRARRWALKNKIPIAYISDSEGRSQGRLKGLLKAFMLRRYFRPISYFLTVGDANEAYYLNHGVSPKKMIRMHFPIDTRQYRQCYANKAALRNVTRNEYGIGDTELILTVVGKLSSWKNQHHIIDALMLLEREGWYFRLFIIGSGEMREAWEEKATLLQHSKVHFSGFVPVEKLPGYYAATDIYIHPASLEPHSIAVSEAIYMGCPVIISDRCGSHGPADDVQQGINGSVFQFGNIEQLVSRIKELAGNQQKRAEFGANSHAIAAAFQQNAHYSVIEKLIAAIKNAAN